MKKKRIAIIAATPTTPPTTPPAIAPVLVEEPLELSDSAVEVDVIDGDEVDDEVDVEDIDVDVAVAVPKNKSATSILSHTQYTYPSRLLPNR